MKFVAHLVILVLYRKKREAEREREREHTYLVNRLVFCESLYSVKLIDSLS